ncbi:hypothetical protein [Sphingobium subterraneum]|uniref:Uncharacterized protein n=1 Tax=Sphingobium subterraneum TaxID=627688 RepID=A0A841JBC7_9SPHN|nr:hypothetical protein [Sphingobium subterraneum]MBB6125421.1 hypothetical protein [Sphingobium subterraneum]
MSNCYTHSCFVLHITAAECGLLREAIALAQYIEDQPDAEAINQHWLGLSEAFRTIFPPTGEEVISGFLAIFPDCDFPTFGTDFSFEQQADGIVRVFATADQFEPDAVAALLHRIITHSLPVMVTWSYDSDRHQPDAFGGGGFRIDAAGIHWIETSKVHDTVHFAPKLVIAMRDPEDGLLFWNSRTGFGSLDIADVFTESQAQNTDLPIADDQPEWLALPACLPA